MNDLIRAEFKEIVKLYDNIKKDDLSYKSKRGKTYNFGKYSLSIVFIRDIYGGQLSIKRADDKQSNFANELKNFEKGTKTFLKKVFLKEFSIITYCKRKSS